MPAAVVASKCVDLVYHDCTQIGEETIVMLTACDQHHFKRLRRREQNVGGIRDDAAPRGIANVAVP